MESSVAQLINYYPKYSYLDDVISTTGHKKMYIFVDLKGCMQSLYQEWAVKYIVGQTKRSKIVDPSIFVSFLQYISFHRSYAKKRGIELEMCFFYELGDSDYHLNVDPSYKNRRKNRCFFDLDIEDIDLFKKTYDKNLAVINRIGNKIPGVCVIESRFLEADFIPWYVLNCTTVYEPDTTYLLYSQDKDMLQCVDKPNVFIFYKHPNRVHMVSPNTIFTHFFKEPCIDIGADYFPLILSLLGDSCDDIPGIKGIGQKTVFKNMAEIKLSTKSMDTVYERLNRGLPLFQQIDGINNKYIDRFIEENEAISRNLRLTSYKLISDYINSGYPVQNIERQRAIVNTLTGNTKMLNHTVLYEALERFGVTDIIDEETVFKIF